jgi:hypothetical protein
MNAQLANFIKGLVDNIDVYRNATVGQTVWERLEYKGMTIKVGIGVDEQGKLFVIIKERDSGV